MDKRTIIWKLICSLVILAAAVLLLSGVLGGDVVYPVSECSCNLLFA